MSEILASRNFRDIREIKLFVKVKVFEFFSA